MISEIRVPKLGMTQTDITVVELTRADEDRVEKDEKVAAIETAKVTYELQAPAAGIIFYLKHVKDKVAIGALLAVVADSPASLEGFKNTLPRAMVPPEADLSAPGAQEPDESEWRVTVSFEDDQTAPSAGRRITPAFEIDLQDRQILKRIPFVGMRRTIADNLVASLQTGAQLTVVAETDMTELSRYRQEIVLDYPDIRITYVDMLVKILAVALQEFPLLNAAVVGDEIICWNEYHIGVAVALESGLVVPVVRNVDRKSLAAVSREIKKLSRKARQNELDPTAYQGGTFTLTSGGRVETDFMTPIINPPQSAILGIGKIGPRPAVYQGQLAIRTVAYLCLSHDHRIVDGVPASLFLGRVKEIIEHRDVFSRILR
jgi:pyruvate dehydrogenase E2 component (dihydrolipoamide acetyltransferase)